MSQHKNHKHAHPNKWMCMDIECDAGCGVVPFKYKDQSFVNSLQWAIGLEIFLLAEDPWKVYLTTDQDKDLTEFISWSTDKLINDLK